MKNEKEIWLDQVELKQLLEGGLYWKDIETKLSPADTEGFKRNMPKEDVSIADIIWEPLNQTHTEILQEEPQAEGDQIRAILLGERNNEEQEEEALSSVPHAAVEEEESEVKHEEKDAFSSRDVVDHLQPKETYEWLTPENKDKHFDDDDFMMELEDKGTPFGGLKLIVLLIVTATVTFGAWYYFISR